MTVELAKSGIVKVFYSQFGPHSQSVLIPVNWGVTAEKNERSVPHPVTLFPGIPFDFLKLY